jgi:hypothetical protein
MIVYLVVYEYECIFVIIIDDSHVINIKFIVYKRKRRAAGEEEVRRGRGEGSYIFPTHVVWCAGAANRQG